MRRDGVTGVTLRRRAIAAVAGLGAAWLAASTGPAAWCGRGAARWFEGEPDGVARLLGYLNLLLGLHRLAFDDAVYAALNDRITAALIRRMQRSGIVLLVSYPREVYPVDNCFVIGSVGLHQRVTGEDHSDIIGRWSRTARRRYVDPVSGLLVQAVSPDDGRPVDAPRGSGTALGLFALHHADAALARALYQAVKTSLAGTCFGFGGVLEYPRGSSGSGDIDSGPIAFGYGTSATGFTIAGARRYRDTPHFRRLFATAHLCGAPVERGGRREYVSGGPLGNAILFAMLTAPREASPTGGGR